MFSRRPDRLWSYVFLGTIAALLLAVLGRCWLLQYYHCSRARLRADRQQRLIIPQNARRGLIVDRNGSKLAISVRADSVAADPSIIQDVQAVAASLAETLQMDKARLRDKLQDAAGRRFLWVKRFVSDAEADKVRQLAIRGVIVTAEWQRRYPMGQLAGHVLGFTDIDGRGLAGIEVSYDEYLSPRPGKLICRSDALRRPIGLGDRCTPGRPGRTVVLTIDAFIQECTERHLAATVEKFAAESAIAIVMDPWTGEVLAMANAPGIDPAKARRSDQSARRNRALTDPVEPGSIFKPFTVAAALDGGFVTARQQIDCLDGPFRARGIGVIREYKRYFGKISVADVIVHSSNIGAAKIALKMGKEHFYRMIRKFGFGSRTGIDLAGEGAGILTPLSQWKWGQYALTRAAFGQGPIATTPIQLIRAFCCFANGGRLVRPRLVRWVLDGETVVKDCRQDDGRLAAELVETGRSAGPSRVISQRVALQMAREILTGVVNRRGGTAHNAYLPGYDVFGKTGTAQIPRTDHRGYEEGGYISSFIAGAPATHPRICVLVMVRRPDRSLGLGYTGGQVAAPAVKEIIRETLAYLGVERRNPDADAVAMTH